MLNVFFVEGIILILFAVLVQLPIVKLYRNEHTYKIVEGAFIVIMLVTILLNVFLSNLIGESWGIPNVVPPYNSGVWTTIIFVIIYLFCFRDFNLGGIVVTKTVKWTQLDDSRFLELYPAFVIIIERSNLESEIEKELFVNKCVSVFKDYSNVTVLSHQMKNLKHSFKFGEQNYYSDNVGVCEMMKCLDVVCRLKGRA